jgi:hypothetical protein
MLVIGGKARKNPRHRWVNNIKIDLRVIGCRDRIDLAQHRDQCTAHMNTVMTFRVSLNVGKFLCVCTVANVSRLTQLHEVIKLNIKTPTATNISACFYFMIFFTTCFGPDQWPSSDDIV